MFLLCVERKNGVPVSLFLSSELWFFVRDSNAPNIIIPIEAMKLNMKIEIVTSQNR